MISSDRHKNSKEENSNYFFKKEPVIKQFSFQ